MRSGDGGRQTLPAWDTPRARPGASASDADIHGSVAVCSWRPIPCLAGSPAPGAPHSLLSLGPDWADTVARAPAGTARAPVSLSAQRQPSPWRPGGPSHLMRPPDLWFRTIHSPKIQRNRSGRGSGVVGRAPGQPYPVTPRSARCGGRLEKVPRRTVTLAPPLTLDQGWNRKAEDEHVLHGSAWNKMACGTKKAALLQGGRWGHPRWPLGTTF
jgi:hypothetical protein